MKRLLIVITILLIAASAQSQKDYRVVFDMTSKDTLNQQALMRELGLIRGSSPEAKMEVVVYGQGLELVLKDKSPQQAAMLKLLQDGGITFNVCAMAMKRNNIEKDQLIPGVGIVPDGIYEIISRQRDGWGYIKVGR